MRDDLALSLAGLAPKDLRFHEDPTRSTLPLELEEGDVLAFPEGPAVVLKVEPGDESTDARLTLRHPDGVGRYRARGRVAVYDIELVIKQRAAGLPCPF